MRVVSVPGVIFVCNPSVLLGACPPVLEEGYFRGLQILMPSPNPKLSARDPSDASPYARGKPVERLGSVLYVSMLALM